MNVFGILKSKLSLERAFCVYLAGAGRIVTAALDIIFSGMHNRMTVTK